jgi:hypothetical protein
MLIIFEYKHTLEGYGQLWKATSLLGSVGQGLDPEVISAADLPPSPLALLVTFSHSVLMQTVSINVRKTSHDTERA